MTNKYQSIILRISGLPPGGYTAIYMAPGNPAESVAWSTGELSSSPLYNFALGLQSGSYLPITQFTFLNGQLSFTTAAVTSWAGLLSFYMQCSLVATPGLQSIQFSVNSALGTFTIEGMGTGAVPTTLQNDAVTTVLWSAL